MQQGKNKKEKQGAIPAGIDVRPGQVKLHAEREPNAVSRNESLGPVGLAASLVHESKPSAITKMKRKEEQRESKRREKREKSEILLRSSKIPGWLASLLSAGKYLVPACISYGASSFSLSHRKPEEEEGLEEQEEPRGAQRNRDGGRRAAEKVLALLLLYL
ncbi:hypothetical protein MGYG_09025 [Nannizzia gypsea CBS 118893]|uniref:Uncharacterized protein n=1 Tax=Arthroderma gypseum (strain ATCC MYA-4604 / CBS 118893) TaxID=535722 RepID=E4UTA5_ARTGP|nr:hypothetical protein MGYG_09025 [Nannizzia gypsea CBS 118893]EFR00666.1 hypothetical protein MGYG_09025 [Nannizzia gypsea CBS 118893]